MKRVIALTALLMAFSFAAFAQMDEGKSSPKPTDKDKTEAIPSESYLKRGIAIGMGKKVSVDSVLKEPSKFNKGLVLIEGVVVRSCKMEGCWAEVGEKGNGKSVRIKMKDHSFFIPLNSEGAWARVEGTVQVKTLSKEQVEHMIKEDGAKFENINADGTVTEVVFEATGIELKQVTAKEGK